MKWLEHLFRRKQGVRGKSPHQQNAEAAPLAEPASATAEKAVSLKEGTPEFDLFIAKGALQLADNLPHGAQHLAALLEVDPARPDWRGLIDQYAAAVPDMDSLVPEAGQRYAFTEALRAYLWQLQGRTSDAIARLLDVTKATGKPNYLHAWALEWLETASAIESLPEEIGIRLFGTILTHSEEAHTATLSTIRYLRRWSQLLEQVAPQYTANSLLLLLRAGLLRKAGRYDEALAVAGSIDNAHEFNHAVAIGLALRRKNMYRESAQALGKAIEIEPDNISGYLEAGDSYFEGSLWPEALKHYEAAMAREPGQPWAEPSSWFCRWKMDGDEAWMQRIREAMRAGNDRAHALVFMEYGALPESHDATANILHHIRAEAVKQSDKGGDISLGVSTLEAPSNRLAAALEIAAFQRSSTLKVSVASIPERDPREPIAEVRYLLWRYVGTDPYPALLAPSQLVLDEIARLASEPYDPVTNWAHASFVADALGPESVQDLLATMIYPPPMPANAKALTWLARLQLSAAQVLGQIDQGWEGSIRREALLSILFGPWDWTTCAAIRVMAWIAREERGHALAIHGAFEYLEQHMPTEGHWDWVRLLYEEWQTLPYLFDDEKQALRAKLDAYDAGE